MCTPAINESNHVCFQILQLSHLTHFKVSYVDCIIIGALCTHKHTKMYFMNITIKTILSHPVQANTGAVKNEVVIGSVVGTAGGLAVVLQLIMVFVLCVIYPKHKKGKFL